MRGLTDERIEEDFFILFILFISDRDQRTNPPGLGWTVRGTLISDLFRGIWSEVLQFCTESNLAILILIGLC